MKILLAEDDLNIATIAEMALSMGGGHEITLCHDGVEALEKGQEAEFDLIILDEMMPELNGLQVCEKLKAMDVKTPIVFFSAKAQQKDIDLFKSMAEGYIPKPFDPATINEQIAEIMAGL